MVLRGFRTSWGRRANRGVPSVGNPKQKLSEEVPVSSSKMFRNVAVMLLVVLGVSCGVEPMGPPTPPPPPPQAGLIGGLLGTVTNLLGGLLTCRPEPFVSASAQIGRNGGTLRFGDHKLVIPAGALSQTVTIRAEVPRDTVNSVRFKPEGLQFARDAELTLDYSNCGLLGGLTSALLPSKPLRVAYTTEALRIIEFVPSTDNRRNKTVTGKLEHFSRYAIAW